MATQTIQTVKPAKTIQQTINLYTFDQLNEQAKERAIASVKSQEFFQDYLQFLADSMFEDEKQLLKEDLERLGFLDVDFDYSISFSQGDHFTITCSRFDLDLLIKNKIFKGNNLSFNKYFREFLHDSDIQVTGFNYVRRNKTSRDYNSYYWTDKDYKKGYDNKIDTFCDCLISKLDEIAYKFYDMCQDLFLYEFADQDYVAMEIEEAFNEPLLFEVDGSFFSKG